MASCKSLVEEMEDFNDDFYITNYEDEPHESEDLEDLEDIRPELEEDYNTEDEEDLVFFIQDSDDEDDEVPSKTEVVETKSPPKQLSQALIDQMTIANVGKLNWAKEDFVCSSLERSEQEKEEYPELGCCKDKHLKRSPKSKFPKSRSPYKVNVNFVSRGPSRFVFAKEPKEEPKEQSEVKPKPETNEQQKVEKHDTVCKFFLRNRTCNYGSKCIYSHVIPPCNSMKMNRRCPKGEACLYDHGSFCTSNPCNNKDCKLYHVKKEDTHKTKGMKTKFCSNIIKTRACPFNESCRYAHTMSEVMSVVDKCPLGMKCNLVSSSFKVDKKDNKKKLVFCNTTPNKQCWKIHPSEVIQNFVARTSYELFKKEGKKDEKKEVKKVEKKEVKKDEKKVSK